MKTVNYKGKDYPIQFNFLVFREWEQKTGRKLSEIAQMKVDGKVPEIDDLLDMITLVYLGVKDACDEIGKEFDIHINHFYRMQPDELLPMIKAIGDAMSGEDLPEGSENKRQPKKTKVVSE